MDFELWYLILVPLLFAAGWFARSFDIKEKQTIANEKDTLYKGVDLLLSNKQDQAIDAFINLVKLDPDTVEMHFSLAGLFRRRGEFDRAIKIHNVLVNREDLPKKIRSRALYELGEDYLKAGLWDRAEECFLKLSDTSESYKRLLARNFCISTKRKKNGRGPLTRPTLFSVKAVKIKARVSHSFTAN